ncbi:MAG: hypothetical protein ACD_25C00074G0002 [uncultured bacterium]|uniref:Type 4 fimbrial biogenesis protein PilX N-terminal domain-containing protein n=1 Tax=candidate division WWE3 bacterium TaxID=2053526 RepID=A0A656PQJ9_UNCKA|nr:hypothetical protein P147_WWE3C00001G0525 [candidate division WWE3 bacterium RAAC2_WWE3_1]EKD95096.1 MAG: hypothetical protein ACD_25C00074G0002 [uncultured bacterium]KKS29011.1 MAG: hypothetical protein UU91_C0010G0006 [candidate division WWE3 bacterium GW2011_GWB1_42_117]KKS55093.1 MAG: hypothetical protein UV21_C0003G0107 [candidate division WWE3 bacterium GW2011_GWD2_42_34]KKT05010.1 MAG: hypothetical protein UV83_C0007G0005 [candidate division WWE3 bacterium GW2011_GWE2_43_18]KKT06323.
MPLHVHTTTKPLTDNRGQALLFVVVALTISMVVGVSVATRTLSVTKRVSSTDTQAKVYYAAEAGIERFVGLPASELAVIATKTSCGSTTQATLTSGECVFFLGASGSVETRTAVTVESFTYNETTPSSHYSTELKNGTFSTVALLNYAGSSLNLCWRNQPSAGNNTALYYTLWSPSALLGKALVIPPGNILDPALKVSGSKDAVGGTGEYTRCTTVNIPSAPSFINIMSIGGDSKVGVFPASSFDLPTQGFKITSKATLKSSADVQQQVVKVIETIRSYNHVPGFFDAAIYAQGNIVAN